MMMGDYHCCQYCTYYTGDACSKDWNNKDYDYYIPERDDRNYDDCCADYEWDGELIESK